MERVWKGLLKEVGYEHDFIEILTPGRENRPCEPSEGPGCGHIAAKMVSTSPRPANTDIGKTPHPQIGSEDDFLEETVTHPSCDLTHVWTRCFPEAGRRRW